MPGGNQQQQQRITSIYVNWVDDPVAGAIVASTAGAMVQPYTGQVGSKFYYDPDQMLRVSDPSFPLFGGWYQYVKFKLGDAFIRGQIVFWDRSVAEDLYQVTASEAGTTASASLKAGIVLNPAGKGPTAGNYGYIQVGGRANVLFRAVLSSPGQTGSAVFAAGAGAGADNGTADVLGGGGAPTVASVAQMMERYIGVAEAAPVGGAVSVVDLGQMVWRQ